MFEEDLRSNDFQDFLSSSFLQGRRAALKVQGIILLVTGSISFIASFAIIYHVLRSHEGLSTTYHRLVFGLCIGDIMSSLGNAFSLFLVPEEMSYLVPYAHGTVTTCNAQGFLINFGMSCVAQYNCSICFYYLSIIRYNKTDEYIKKRLEPWFHSISILVPLSISISCLALKMFNTKSIGSICYAVPHNPPHCIDYEDGDTPYNFSIPCGRGDLKDSIVRQMAVQTLYALPIAVTPIIIVVTMFLMYRAVYKIEKKVQKYGANSFRLRAQEPVTISRHTDATGNASSINSSISRTSLKKMMSIVSHRQSTSELRSAATSRSSNKGRSRKRTVLYMALSYSMSWSFVFIPAMISHGIPNSDVTAILATIFVPLQGLLNLGVYMMPKVRSAKNNGKKAAPVTWRKAIKKAWLSKGRMKRRRSLAQDHIAGAGYLERVKHVFHRLQKKMSISEGPSTSIPRSAAPNVGEDERRKIDPELGAASN